MSEGAFRKKGNSGWPGDLEKRAYEFRNRYLGTLQDTGSGSIPKRERESGFKRAVHATPSQTCDGQGCRSPTDEAAPAREPIAKGLLETR